ncbi:nuclear pore complex protein Nup205-like [Brachionus plicatilis]|uniref:Nuclear pore complex protein Nup205-like n=1 Tax=Brachionus plicatilis TaxID=10195 RepID=A0A3M7SAB7_BRAPC|nr:nuclear pore complex protein Nup205-like [Brachionus plicatilis]
MYNYIIENVGVLIGKKYDLFATLQDELNKNFNHFLDILKDVPSNPAERVKVQKSNEEAIQINFLNCQKKLQPSVIEEAIALSDLFTLSELSSVELLVEAEEQMQYFHGFNRGLTAVLLYYDSKKIQMNSLKTLLLARSGRTWILDESTPAEITNFIDSFVQRLVQNGLIEKILAQIGVHEWSKAEENLVRVNGLGSLKHRKQVKNLFEEVKILLGECVFSCACQVPLDNQSTISVINFLKNNSQMIQSNQLDSKLNLDTSHFFLLMALFYCFDTSYLENKEHVEIDAILKSFLQNDYVHNIYNELNKADNAQWSNLGIKSSLQFSFQIFISNLNYFMIENENQSYTQLLANNISGLEEDDNLIDKSIEQHVFSFFKNTIIQHERFHCEKFVLVRVHNMVTDFIYRMPEKIKDMRNRNEDLQRLVEDSYSNQSQSSFYYNAYSTQSINRQPAVAHDSHDFEDFLEMIGHLYANNTLNLELCLNYWIADSEMNANMANNYQKPSQKQISLYKFVRYFLSGDTLIGSLYIAYVNMLTGLCTGEQSAQHCFCLLQNNSHFYDSHGPKISWMHITTAFEKYYESFRTNQTNVMLNMVQQRASSNKGITQQELKGLIAVTKLVRQIALYSEKARLALCQYQRNTDTFNTSTSLTCLNENTLPMCLFGLLTCSIPNSLKGEILNLLATFALSPQIAINLWQSLENSQLIPTTASTSSTQSTSSQSQQYFYKHDIKTELEEVESREEAYPLLKALQAPPFYRFFQHVCTFFSAYFLFFSFNTSFWRRET